ncbi:FAD-dependent oxidoreductase [Sansalvadorimonas sp. 2012CJ34-2]|uniref:FAD-dependent oxidoreductase n=1 Tax=Parendozoicomonas callyspongiae TaxID=2942213 RepID=A0ABT0PCX2_9GAMM|nr:FAD-dependent oxidoreductase [Sansalvadorimonas sp. 2012CJ34-2]MCL6268597.1 FAD-dependent oxidoreductase [Sansalvadorimonas sp. 2012CJ34-2]
MKGWKLESRLNEISDLPVLRELDVLVVGGGSAGVAAATTCGRNGLKTALIEKYGFCGGSAVAGMSGTICGMYLGSDDPAKAPEQVVFGFTEEFRQNLKAKGGVTEPLRYGKTFTVTHDPLMWREVADEMLMEAGVEIFYHSAVTGVVMDDQTYKGVVVESNAGRTIILAKRIIDASGDAAVVARAGGEYFFGDNGVIQNPTMFFRLGGVDMNTYLDYYGEDTICPPDMTAKILELNASGEYALPRHKIWIFPTTRPGELMVNATRLAGQDGRVLNVIDPVDFTEAEVFGRKQMREYARFLKNFVPGCEESYVVDTSVEVGIRQTRSIEGVDKLSNDDVVNCRKYEDSICRSPWPIELHSGTKPKLHWLIEDWYDVPYGTLLPRFGENIIVAGRCLSAEHEALASARVTAQTFEYGHAAGQACVLSLKNNISFRELSGKDVRDQMVAAGSHI